MARSQYIYLVTQQDQIVAAFTVKHEMETWLSRKPGLHYKRFRMRDGLYYDKNPVAM